MRNRSTAGGMILLILIFLFSHRSFSQTFAAIGDYGFDGANEAAVASLVKSWNPEFIITLGDNNYSIGSASTIDANIGKYYHDFIYPYTGIYGGGAASNRFFPSLGNHDWATAGAVPYLNYFTLPGNERYYDYVKGFVHFFVIDSDPNEPHGRDSNSVQALWLKNALLNSVSEWNLVYFHHSPYCSDASHGSDPTMQWPFRNWGADAVLTGHSHVYERLIIDDFPYFVNGLGGRSIYSFSSTILGGSQMRYNSSYGAMKIIANEDNIEFNMVSTSGTTVDSYTISKNLLTSVAEFDIYPNPFQASFELNTYASRNGEASFILYDSAGKKVIDQNVGLAQGNNKMKFYTAGLAAGIYYAKLQTSDKTYSKKLILFN
jgi:tartrate-resistant acid phosphatase type 5